MNPQTLPDEMPVRAGMVNIDAPRWDQSSFEGRAKHFFATTNPANLLLSSNELEEAKRIVKHYKLGVVAPGLTIGRLWDAKTKYDSAFHPDTGEKMLLIGRMSAQVPMNTLITAGMMTFYRSTPAVVFWQWVNQSFNAVVNYSNRSGDKPISQSQLYGSYAIATSAAMATGLGLNAMTKSLPPIAGRLVPFCAVAAANCLNIPFMRQGELREGIPVFDADGNRLGESKVAASDAIKKVVVSRIMMATPGMVLPTFVMNYFDTKTTLFKRAPWAPLPMQLVIIAFCLTFATPMCCAAFPQKSSLPVDKLEHELQDSIRARRGGGKIDRVYFNKGL